MDRKEVDMEMVPDEQNQRGCTSSSGGGRSSKKGKQKKIPQRGLGVAQLERIRLEEQQKKDSIGNLSSSSPTKFQSSSYLSNPLSNFHSNQSSSSPVVPFSPCPGIDLPFKGSLFKPPLTIPSIDDLPLSNIPLGNQINGGSYEIGWPLVPGHVSDPKLWNSEQGLLGQNLRLDHQLSFHGNVPYESNHIFSRPNVMQRNQQPCPSMVNVSTLTSSSSVPRFQMEPPSNQSYYGNYTPLWPEEDKMVGMKIPYPFSLENSTCPSFHYKVPPFDGPITRSNESAPCDNGGTHNFYPSSRIFREASPCSTFISKPYPKDIIENGVLNGDFLTLAPPTTASPCPSSTFKHKPAYSNSCNQELSEFELFPYQGSAEGPIHQHQPISSLHPIHSFLPPAKVQTIQAGTSWSNVNSARENIDLNLKL